MLFFSSNKPEIKLKRIAKHLHLQLEKCVEESRIKHQRAEERCRQIDAIEDRGNKIFCKVMEINADTEFRSYKRFVTYSSSMVTKLSKDNPDYKNIKFLAEALKRLNNMGMPIFSIIDGQKHTDIYSPSGATLLTDLVDSIGGLLEANALLIVCLCSFPFYLANSQYCCGTPTLPQFFLSSLYYFCDSVLKAISSIIVPIALLRSKYETDSWNVFKGELIRTLDSAIALSTVLAQEEEENSNSPSSDSDEALDLGRNSDSYNSDADENLGPGQEDIPLFRANL